MPHYHATSLLLVASLLSAASSPVLAEDSSVSFGRFGQVTIYREAPNPSRLVLFVSGDGGWNSGVVDMARSLASLDATVAGIDITRYMKSLESSSEKCVSPAVDFEALSQFLQKKFATERYTRPILVGYSSGATLVYGTLVQAPTGTFAGAVSLGFCPDLALRKPMCRGSGLETGPSKVANSVDLLAAPKLDAPWAVLQGQIDQVCDPAGTQEFVGSVPAARYIALPKVGHGFSVQRNWMPQFRDAFKFVAEGESKTTTAADALPAELESLPVTLIPPVAGATSDLLAVMISGDGGWAGLDRDVGTALAGKGVGVVGLDSLAYFWTRRTPDETTRAIGDLLNHYLGAWQRKRVVLIGYSFGADIAPFVAARLPPALRGKLAAVALLGPDDAASFEFHVGDWLGGDPRADTMPVQPEIARIAPTPVLCLYGAEESGSLCRNTMGTHVRTIQMRGGHHFNGDYNAIAERVLGALN